MFLEPDSHLAPFVRRSLWKIQNRYIWLPLLRLNLWDDFRKIFRGTKWRRNIAKIQPVKRLFSLGGQIETRRRNRLSDDSFEQLLLLKANIKAYEHMLPWQ